MSESSRAYLFRVEYEPEVIRHIPTSPIHAYTHRLNAEWSALLISEISCEYNIDEQVLVWVRSLSCHVPLLFIYRYSDGYWGFRIFDHGQETAQLAMSYDLEVPLVILFAEQRYPEEHDIVHLFETNPQIYRGLLEEVYASQALAEIYAAQFEDKNISAFRVFDLNDETIERLDRLLSPETDLDGNSISAEFDRILGFPEFEYCSHGRYM